MCFDMQLTLFLLPFLNKLRRYFIKKTFSLAGQTQFAQIKFWRAILCVLISSHIAFSQRLLLITFAENDYTQVFLSYWKKLCSSLKINEEKKLAWCGTPSDSLLNFQFWHFPTKRWNYMLHNIFDEKTWIFGSRHNDETSSVSRDCLKLLMWWSAFAWFRKKTCRLNCFCFKIFVCLHAHFNCA